MKLDYRRRVSGPRAGFTLLELLAVIFIIVIVAAILLPTVHHTHEPANRVKCGSNLRQIGQAILLYSNENKGAYPRTAYDPGAPLTWGTGVSARNPFTSPDAPKANDVTAAMFLLIRTQDITSEVFVCPVQNRDLDPQPDRFGGGSNTAQDRSNFTDWRVNLSYGLANPYPTKAVVDKGYCWNSTLGAEFAVAADINPGGGQGLYDVTLPTEFSNARDMQKANSPNHSGAGENVLYGDGHVEFQQNPFVGTKRDNIYTVAGGTPEAPTTTSKTVVGSPTWAGDSVMLPALK